MSSATLLDSVVHIVASDEEEEDLRTLQHQNNLLMLLVLVITPYYLRTLYDYTLSTTIWATKGRERFEMR